MCEVVNKTFAAFATPRSMVSWCGGMEEMGCTVVETLRGLNVLVKDRGEECASEIEAARQRWCVPVDGASAPEIAPAAPRPAPSNTTTTASPLADVVEKALLSLAPATVNIPLKTSPSLMPRIALQMCDFLGQTHPDLFRRDDKAVPAVTVGSENEKVKFNFVIKVACKEVAKGLAEQVSAASSASECANGALHASERRCPLFKHVYGEVCV